MQTSPHVDRVLDATGLKCPQPILKLSVISANMRPGETLEIIGDCPTFEKDITGWCLRLKKTLLVMRDEGDYRKSALIRF
jgi:tRNA 2-thiouridine synthesizing protein A